MEITVNMAVSGEDESGRIPNFNIDAFYPGHANMIPPEEFWGENLDDVSPIPVAQLLYRGFNMKKMVVIKKPDNVTQKLIKACLEKTKMDALISIYMTTNKNSTVWVGQYSFKFILGRFLANQPDLDGKLDVLYLDIVEGSLKDMGLDK